MMQNNESSGFFPLLQAEAGVLFPFIHRALGRLLGIVAVIRQTVRLRRPLTKVDQLAAFRTERPVDAGGAPDDDPAALGAVDFGFLHALLMWRFQSLFQDS